MIKRNQWAGGPIELELPPLPRDLQGVSACLLQTGIFNPDIGDEVFLTVLDTDFDWRSPDAEESLNLHLKSGVTRTSHGLLAFLIWIFYEDSKRVAFFEQYVNPMNFVAIQLLSSAGQQEYLKVVFCNSLSGQVEDFVEFENLYSLDELLATIARTVGHEPVGSFQLAQQGFMDEYPIEALLGDEE